MTPDLMAFHQRLLAYLNDRANAPPTLVTGGLATATRQDAIPNTTLETAAQVGYTQALLEVLQWARRYHEIPS